MQHKKILITGGAGFIGSNLALRLVSEGCDVTVLDNLSPQIHGSDPVSTSPLYISIQDKVNFIKGDVRSYDDWVKAIAENEVIVHLAAETGTGQSMYQIDHYTKSNIGGTALMLDIITNTTNKVKKVVVASSRAIYGEGKYLSDELGIIYPVQRKSQDMDKGNFEVTCPGSSSLKLMATDEDSKIHPTSIYGITKQTQEQMVLVACAAKGISAIAFRYQNVYGPGQSLSNPYTGILSIFSTQIKNGLPINIFEDGMESRDFVFIDDVVSATILGIEHDNAGINVFNVGHGVATTVLEVAQTLMNNYDREVPLTVTGNYRIGDIRHNYADLSKIKNELGFQPEISFAAGIQQFCNWVNGQQLQQSQYDSSLDEMKQKGLFR
ncbi:MAG: NAD-dependent epimerase/dehydratase family protein [Ferruginibacter sp.]